MESPVASHSCAVNIVAAKEMCIFLFPGYIWQQRNINQNSMIAQFLTRTMNEMRRNDA